MQMYKFYCSSGCESEGEIFINEEPTFCPSCGVRFDADDVSKDDDDDDEHENWDDDDENWNEDEKEYWNKR